MLMVLRDVSGPHGRAGRRARPPAQRCSMTPRRAARSSRWSAATPAWASPGWSRRSRGSPRAAGSPCCPASARSSATACPTCRWPTRCGAPPRPGAVRDALSSRAGPGHAAARGRRRPHRSTRTAPAWPGSRCSAACSACSPSSRPAGPVLLVLEDLHWADRSTRDLVTFLSRMLHRERVALIGTYRTDDLHRRHPLRPVVAELLRLPGVIAVELAPLDPAALAEHLTRGRARPDRRHRAERHRGPGRGQRLLRRGTARRRRLSGDGPEQSLPAGLAALLLSPGGAALRRRPAGAPRGGGGRAAGRRRAGPGRVGPGCRPSTRTPCGRRVTHQLLVPDGTEGYVFRHALLREAVYADLLPGERTRLHAHDERAAGRRAPAGRAGNRGRAGPPLPGQPRHPRRVRRVGQGGRGGGAAGRAGRGAPALRPGARPVGAGRPSRRRRPAWPAASSACCPRPTRRTAATSTGPCTCSAGCGMPSPSRPTRGRRREPGQPDRRAARLLPVDDRRRQGHRRGRRDRPGHGGRDARAAADLAVRPGGGHLRQHPAGRRRLRRGPRAGRARARRGPRGRCPLGGGRRAGHPGVPQQPRRPQRRGHQAADPGAQAGPRRPRCSAWSCARRTSWPGRTWSAAT